MHLPSQQLQVWRWRQQRTFYGYSVCYNNSAALHTIALEGGFLMTIEITIQVPDMLGQQLQQLHDRLPEVLERGLRDVLAEETGPPYDEHAIIAILTSQPAPEQVLAIRPSSELQSRASELQERSKHGTLTAQERTELDRYLLLEHMVRIAKANAYPRRAKQS
jgi:hypothetical protein